MLPIPSSSRSSHFIHLIQQMTAAPRASNCKVILCCFKCTTLWKWPRRADLVEIVPSAADSDVRQQHSNTDVGACKHWQLTALAASVISSVITRLCEGTPGGGDPTVTWPTTHRQQDRSGGGSLRRMSPDNEDLSCYIIEMAQHWVVRFWICIYFLWKNEVLELSCCPMGLTALCILLDAL